MLGHKKKNKSKIAQKMPMLSTKSELDKKLPKIAYTPYGKHWACGEGVKTKNHELVINEIGGLLIRLGQFSSI